MKKMVQKVAYFLCISKSGIVLYDDNFFFCKFQKCVPQ